MPDPLRLVAQHKRPEADDLPVSERLVPQGHELMATLETDLPVALPEGADALPALSDHPLSSECAEVDGEQPLRPRGKLEHVISRSSWNPAQDSLPVGRMRSEVMRSCRYPRLEEQLSGPCVPLDVLHSWIVRCCD